MKQEIDNVIFTTGSINIRAGGPLGYIANLKEGLEKNHISNIRIISFEHHITWLVKLGLFFINLIPLKQIRKSVRKKYKERFYFESYDHLQNYGRFIPDTLKKHLYNELDKYSFKSVTCHMLSEFPILQEYLTGRNIKVKTLIQSHSPEAPSSELKKILLLNGVSEKDAEAYRREAFRLDKKAFVDADIVLFPSKEAMEPYSEFADVLESKKIHFITTGIKPLTPPNKTYEDLRKFFKIKTKFVISYIGRHTSVKGYDILKETGREILEKRDDVTFLIGGTGELSPLDHPRWLEIGKCNPSEVLKISDAFILPNKQTYFDLILLETLSMGVPVFASETGGNKSVADQTGCVTLYRTKEELIRKIIKFLDCPIADKMRLKDEILSAFSSNYTQAVFADNYQKLIQNVLHQHP